MKILRLLGWSSVVTLFTGLLLHAIESPQYKVLGEYVIGSSGTHYLASDELHIYVPHDHVLVVLNADTGKIVANIPVAEGHIRSVVIAPDLKRGFVYAEPNSITMFDTQSLTTLKKVTIRPGDEDGDLGFLVYDPYSKRVFPILNNSTVLDARTGERLGELTLGSGLGTGVADGKGTVYFTVQDRGTVVGFNAVSLKTTGTYPVDDCLKPQSLSYDAAGDRLFVGCHENGRLAVLDASTGKMVANELICSGSGGSAFDSNDKLIFESCGEGVMSIIRQLGPDDYEVVDSLKTARYAAFMTFVPNKNRIYLNVVDAGKHKPGNLRVLVLGL
jgi:outer membrane protein assembly factor BamB